MQDTKKSQELLSHKIRYFTFGSSHGTDYSQGHMPGALEIIYKDFFFMPWSRWVTGPDRANLNFVTEFVNQNQNMRARL